MRWWLLIISVSWVFAAGCEKPLFPENLPRTQYERFDRIRGIYTPKEGKYRADRRHPTRPA